MTGISHASSIDSAGPPDPAATWEETLPISADFDAPWVEAAVAWIVERQRPRAAVDVGCGAGGAACALAAALGASGRVTAVDVDPRLVAAARRRAVDARVSGRIGFAVGDVAAPCVPPGSAELVWASGVVHHLADQQAGVDRLVALLAAGGRLALVEGGLPMRCLPNEIGIGRPGLEARLDEARARWFVELRHGLGGVALPYGWPEALRRAGARRRGGPQLRRRAHDPVRRCRPPDRPPPPRVGGDRAGTPSRGRRSGGRPAAARPGRSRLRGAPHRRVPDGGADPARRRPAAGVIGDRPPSDRSWCAIGRRATSPHRELGVPPGRVVPHSFECRMTRRAPRPAKPAPRPAKPAPRPAKPAPRPAKPAPRPAPGRRRSTWRSSGRPTTSPGWANARSRRRRRSASCGPPWTSRCPTVRSTPPTSCATSPTPRNRGSWPPARRATSGS